MLTTVGIFFCSSQAQNELGHRGKNVCLPQANFSGVRCNGALAVGGGTGGWRLPVALERWLSTVGFWGPDPPPPQIMAKNRCRRRQKKFEAFFFGLKRTFLFAKFFICTTAGTCKKISRKQTLFERVHQMKDQMNAQQTLDPHRPLHSILAADTPSPCSIPLLWPKISIFGVLFCG